MTMPRPLSLLCIWFATAPALAAPAETHYARDLAAAMPDAAAKVVVKAQQDLEAAISPALAGLERVAPAAALLSDESAAALNEMEQLRPVKAADTVVKLMASRSDLVERQGTHRPTFMTSYPATAAAVSIGWPCLPAVDKLAVSSDSPSVARVCEVFYRWVLGCRGIAAAKARLDRLIAAGATEEVRERCRVIARSINAGEPYQIDWLHWDRKLEARLGNGAVPRRWQSDRQRYFETEALLAALPAWLDDPQQPHRAVAALRILAILRSAEAGPLLCQRLTWADPSAPADAPLDQRYPAAATLIAIGHPMFEPFIERLLTDQDTLSRQLEAEVLVRTLGGRAEARAFLKSEELRGMDLWWGDTPFGAPPGRPLKVLAESDWLKGDDPPLVARPLVVQP